MEKKLKKGIKNIFAFNIEIDLPIANNYLENCLISINKPLKMLRKGIENILAIREVINEQKKVNDDDLFSLMK